MLEHVYRGTSYIIFFFRLAGNLSSLKCARGVAEAALLWPQKHATAYTHICKSHWISRLSVPTWQTHKAAWCTWSCKFMAWELTGRWRRHSLLLSRLVSTKHQRNQTKKQNQHSMRNKKIWRLSLSHDQASLRIRLHKLFHLWEAQQLHLSGR